MARNLNKKIFTANGTWVCPAGVTSVDVECWGGGGSGGIGAGDNVGTGGGGGAYAKKTIAVVPGTSYDIVVGVGAVGRSAASGAGSGNAGGDTYFDDGSEVLAKGGGAGNASAASLGGQSGDCVGDTKYSGGGCPVGQPSGGGGAGTTGAGNDASGGSTGGNNKALYGGKGTNASWNVNGYMFGGGTSGRYANSGNSTYTGGKGGIIISWAAPIATAGLIKVISLYNGTAVTRATATYAIPANTASQYFDPAVFDGDVEVYFEAVVAIADVAGAFGAVALYNDGGTIVAGSELNIFSKIESVNGEYDEVDGVTPKLYRSGNIAANMATADDFDVRTIGDGTNNLTLYAARLVIVQSGTVTKTETEIELGNTYASVAAGGGAEIANSGYFKYLAANWDGITKVYFEAEISSSVGFEQARCYLLEADNDQIEDVSNDTTTYVRTRSADCFAALVNNTIYKIGSDAPTACRIRAARIIIQQENFTKTESYLPLRTAVHTNTSTAGANLYGNQYYDASEWGVDVTFYHEVTMKISSATKTANADLNDGSSDLDTLSTTGDTSKHLLESAEISLSDHTEHDTQLRIAATSATATLYGSHIKVLVTLQTVDLPTVTTQAASSVTKDGATGNGNITDTGGENCTKRGVVYGTTSKSAPGNVAPASSDYDSYGEDTGDYGTGAFTKAVTGLSDGQVYYMRAYAYNSAGYAYGDEVSFTTINVTDISKGAVYRVKSTPDEKTKALAYSVQTIAAITKGIVYKVKAEIGITKGLVYAVKAGAAATKTLAYRVKTTPAATEKALVYAVQTETAATKTAEYRVKTSVAATKTLDYEVKSEVGITKSLAYGVITIAALTKGLVYSIKKPQAITKDLAYAIHTTPAIEKDLAYLVKTITGITKGLVYAIPPVAAREITKDLGYFIVIPTAQTKGLEYVIKGGASQTKALVYCVKAEAAATKALAYRVLTTPTAITKALVYTVKAPQATTKALAYLVRTYAGIEKGLEYTTKGGAVKALGLAYAVQTAAGVTKGQVYAIRTQGAQSKALAYEVKAAAGITKATKYCVTAPAETTLALAYAIETNSAITKGQAYKVKSPKANTLSLVYKIDSPASITKALAYVVAQRAAVTKGLSYRVQTSAAKTKALEYAVQTEGAISKALRYYVYGYGSISKTLEYTVTAEIGITKALAYVVRIRPYTKKTSPYVHKTIIFVRKASPYTAF